MDEVIERAAVKVGGVEIPAAAIAAEAQNHPAPDAATAWTEASEALAIRQLLLAEAECRAGQSTACVADADRVLAASPDNVMDDSLVRSPPSATRAGSIPSNPALSCTHRMLTPGAGGVCRKRGPQLRVD